MKRRAILIAVALLSTFVLAADNNPPKAVKVTGTSDVNVTPDKATINIGIEKQSPSAATAKKAADTAAREILAALHSSGVQEKDITTDWLSLSPQYNWRDGKITYFVAEQSLTVTVRDLAKLDTLLDSLIKAGGNRINSIQFETSDLRKYRDQARQMAVTAAREKAEDLAKALGQSIGKAISVEEEPQYSNPWGYAYGGLMANSTPSVGEGAPPPRPSIAAGERKVSASVTVWFELM